MNNIIHLHDFLPRKQLNEYVIPFFRKLNPLFQYFMETVEESREAVFFLHHRLHIVVFIKFIPKNIFTELPSLSDSFQDIKNNPRRSKGEWVVDGIYELEYAHADLLSSELQHHLAHPVSFFKKQFK